MRLILAAVAAFILAACASMGRPTGGEYDVDPPVYVQSNPAIGSVNFKKNHITIDFNENVQVEDVMNKVVVSPPQKNIPSITANGKRVTAELRDSMLDNTTYTIDFSDAIKDLNEGNTLDGFAIDFSTGDSIDSLRIAGMVFEARTLEPAQNMLVGVYSNLSDTAITTLPLERIGRTNQLGQFIIRGLKPGNYRIYALNDINRDYHWDRSEDVAFYDVTVSPYAEPTTVNDTLITLDGRDSIVTHPGTNYFPNDILLTWFNEGYKAQYLKDYTRPDRRRLLLNLAAPSDTFPTITLLNGPAAGKRIDELAILNTGMTRDTLEYFITDTALMAQDTMMLALHFLRTDTLQQLSWGDDTIRVLYREPKANKTKEKKVKKKKDDEEKSDSIVGPQLTFLNISAKTSNTQEIYLPIIFEMNQPLDTIIPEGLHLEMIRDTIFDTLAVPELVRVDPFNTMRYKVEYKWEPGVKYRFSADSASIVGIYNEWNKPFKHEFTARALEDYSLLAFNVTGVRDSAIVEVLGSDDNPVAIAPLKDGVAEFPYLQPGTYYARLYIDRNGNGEYDTGNLLDSIQPEEVYYYPKKIVLKKNWDVEQSWDIYETPIDLQKPQEIKKNKPKEKKRRRNPDGTFVEDENDNRNRDEDEDGYYDDTNFFGPGNPNGSSNIGNMNNQNNLRNLRR